MLWSIVSPVGDDQELCTEESCVFSLLLERAVTPLDNKEEVSSYLPVEIGPVPWFAAVAVVTPFRPMLLPFFAFWMGLIPDFVADFLVIR